MAKNPLRLSDAASITPARQHFLIVPSDTAVLSVQPKAIYCQADGTIVITDESGVDLPYAMKQGQILPVRALKVKAAGTTGSYYGWL